MTANQDRTDMLQQYLVAVASCLEARADSADPRAIEELRQQADRALESLEEAA